MKAAISQLSNSPSFLTRPNSDQTTLEALVGFTKVLQETSGGAALLLPEEAPAVGEDPVVPKVEESSVSSEVKLEVKSEDGARKQKEDNSTKVQATGSSSGVKLERRSLAVGTEGADVQQMQVRHLV